MLHRIEVGLLPSDDDLIAISIVSFLVEGTDLNQRTYAFCLDELCKSMVEQVPDVWIQALFIL